MFSRRTTKYRLINSTFYWIQSIHSKLYDNPNLTQATLITRCLGSPAYWSHRLTMPVFRETAHAARDLRILPSRVLPLPRRTPRPQKHAENDEKYEVVVIGVSYLIINALAKLIH